MIHYLCLFQESRLSGGWITRSFYKKDPDENKIPATTGLFSKEFQNDNLDLKRAIDFLEETKWEPIKEVSRLKNISAEQVLKVEGTSAGLISLTIDEFLTLKGGAITGIFFDVEGCYCWHQRYFLDSTKPT